MQPPVVNLFTYLFTARDVRVSVGFIIKIIAKYKNKIKFIIENLCMILSKPIYFK